MVAALRLSRVLTLALLVSAAAAQAMAPAPAMSVEDVMAMLEAEKESIPWSIEDLGKGKGAPANCTADGTGMPDTWMEITDIIAYKQYVNEEGDVSLIPDPLPMPYTVSSEVTRAPGWTKTCVARSPSAPADCEGAECDVLMEEWGVTWREFAILNCAGSYPTPGLINFFTSPTPPPGQIGFSVTNTCKNYYYEKTDQWDFFYSVTDDKGGKWALQTAPLSLNVTTAEQFEELMAKVVFPPGFGPIEKVPLKDGEVMEQQPFVVGNGCYAMVFKDNNYDSWHLYTYPEGGLTSGNSILGAMGKSCEVLNANYTLSALGGMAPAPAPAAAPAPVSTATGLRASAALLAGAAAAAALLF